MLLLLFLTYLVRALRLYSYFRPATIGRFGLSLSIMLTQCSEPSVARTGRGSKSPVLLRQHLGVDLAWYRRAGLVPLA